MSLKRPIYDAYVGEGIPDLALWVRVDKRLLTGTSYTYSMTCRDADDTVDLFVKTNGFTGQVGSGDGSAIADIPNVLISWDASAETSRLTAGRMHEATLAYTRISDSKVGYYAFLIRGVEHQ